MASSSSSQSCNCDVFLSFRGEDTRKTFVDHLYTALVDRKIPTYKDDETLPRGESIRPCLFKAIKGSRIAVIIFSKNYADSSWCLDELAYIMKCKIKRGLIVMPVFYDVAPSEVRKQNGDFGKGFSKQEAVNISKVESWRKALVEASEISGWEPKHIANGHESKVTKDIADTISKKLYPVTSDDDGLVGMSSRLEELEAKLDIGSSDVQMLGIWGVGGGGKTTLAYSFYKKISHHFQGHCFIDNIREESSKHHGLKTLQENIISRLLKTKMELQSVEEGKGIIRSRLNHSNVLIILDDVNDIEQLDALAGSHSWFGGGSLIIVTTRDEHLLKTHKVDLVCPITLLSHEDAIMLFNKHAYNKDNPLIDYEALSSRVITYAAGLPLALKVLGSFLYDKDEKEWMSTLARLKDIPEMKIIEKLKLSYDGLNAVEKELFLDIACFFRRSRINYAMEALEACGYHPDVGITVLSQKSLITIENDIFDMHDLVQEMGHHIVRGEYPNDPSKHSRVWKFEEINNMCASDVTTENDQIEAISYNVPHHGHHGDHLSLFYKFVSNMKKLRIIHVKPDKDVEDEKAKGPTFLSNELHYIHWMSYPKTPFPNTFKAAKLVILKLSFSLQKELWKGCKHLPNLKVLKLNFMPRLLTTPDFDGLPSLQNLTLNDCVRLKKIHPSLGKHTCLEHVTVMRCFMLRAFPTIIRMTKLKTLEIQHCHESLNFPKIESNMDSLVKLSLDGVGIDVLPLVIERCAHLISLQLKRCNFYGDIVVDFDGLKQLEEFELSQIMFKHMPDHVMLSWLIGKVACGRDLDTSLLNSWRLPYNLQKLNLSYCGLKDGEIPSCIGEMFNLEELDLSENDFTRLDFTLSELTRLKLLDISYTSLVEFPKLPSSLLVLRAEYLRGSVTTIGDSLTNCKRLCEVSLKGVKILSGCNKLLESMIWETAVKNRCKHLISEGTQIAKEFIPPLLMTGITCRLKLPDNWCNDFSGFLLCAVVKEGQQFSPFHYVTIEQVVSGMESQDELAWKDSDDNKRTHVWYVSFASLRHTIWWNSIYRAHSISFKSSNEIGNEGFGVRMVAQKSRSSPLETSIQEEYDFCRYEPRIRIDQDSQYALKIWPTNHTFA